MKKVGSRLESLRLTTTASSPTAEDEEEATTRLGFLINRPESLGAGTLTQNSNFFQKLQLSQNSLRGNNSPRLPESFSAASSSSSSEAAAGGQELPGQPDANFLPLGGPPKRGQVFSTTAKTTANGAVFPQELDIITASGNSGGTAHSSAAAAGFFEDFEFVDEEEEEEGPRRVVIPSSRPAQNLFRVSSQLKVGGGGEEEEVEDLRFPGTVLEDATTRKIGELCEPFKQAVARNYIIYIMPITGFNAEC